MEARDCDDGMSLKVIVNPFHAHDCDCGQCEPAREDTADVPDCHPDEHIAIVEDDSDNPAMIARDLADCVNRLRKLYGQLGPNWYLLSYWCGIVRAAAEALETM